MNKVLLLTRRELAATLNTSWGWAILAVVLLIDGLLFNAFALGRALLGQRAERFLLLLLGHDDDRGDPDHDAHHR
jgi:hypothetical protein